MAKLFAGLDVSTKSCKLVIIDWDEKTEVHVEGVNYDQDLPHYQTQNGEMIGNQPGVSESNPLMWVEAVDTVFERAKNKFIPLKHIKAIAVSGQQHGLVALDAKGNLARPASKLWNDFSTQEECDLLTERVGGVEKMISEIGNTQRTGYTAAKIYHMVRHEKDAYDRSTILFLVHNYINWYLTGGVAVMEPGDTSGTALWNPVSKSWSEKVISSIDENLAKKLPPVQSSQNSIGTISSDLVERFGFSPECKIDAGSGDNMYSAIGTGNVKPGIVTVSLGTSGTAYSFMEKPYVDPAGEIAAFCDSTGNYLPLLCISNLANGYDKFLSLHGLNHIQFDEMVSMTLPGNEGRLLIPWYEGERTPDLPLASAVYFGFDLSEFEPRFLARAILEGHVNNLYDGSKKLPVSLEKIHLTGGLSQSPTWCQAIADIFGAETIPIQGEGAAFGAALHAAWVWLMEEGYSTTIDDVVNNFIQYNEPLHRKPQPEYQDIYQKQKALYQSLSNRIRGLEGQDPFLLRAELINI